MSDLQPRYISRQALAILLPAIAQLALHLLWTTGYNLSGDELYAIACSNTPAAGYVDIAPIPVLLLALQRLIGGDTLFAIRSVSAIVAALGVYTTGLIARRMGAGVFGQFLAVLCALIAPAFLFAGHVATPFGYAILSWAIGTYIMVRLLQEPKPFWWILLGLVSGAGFLSSFSVAFFIIAAVISILLSPLRKHLLTVWPWAGAAVAIIVMLPWIIWQAGHAWATLEWLNVAYHAHTSGTSIADTLAEQVKLLHPLTMMIWLPALGLLCFSATFRPRLAIGVMYSATLILMLTAGMEPHYMVPAAIGLFATGAIAVEKVLRRSWMRATAAVLLVIGGTATLPMALPVLDPRSFIEYEKQAGFRIAMGNTDCTDRLPGYYGAMFGRKELAVVMNAVFSSMPPEDRRRYGVLCETAEQAASLDFYGKDSTVPPPVSGNRQYWFRGPGTYIGDRLVVVGGNEKGLRTLFGEVQLRMRFRDEYLHPGNGMTPIWIVGKPVEPLKSMWDRMWTVK